MCKVQWAEPVTFAHLMTISGTWYSACWIIHILNATWNEWWVNIPFTFEGCCFRVFIYRRRPAKLPKNHINYLINIISVFYKNLQRKGKCRLTEIQANWMKVNFTGSLHYNRFHWITANYKGTHFTDLYRKYILFLRKKTMAPVIHAIF